MNLENSARRQSGRGDGPGRSTLTIHMAELDFAKSSTGRSRRASLLDSRSTVLQAGSAQERLARTVENLKSSTSPGTE